MGIFSALLDKLVPADEHGSRGAADIIVGAGSVSLGAAGGLEAAKAIGGQMKEMVSGMREGGDVVSAASEKNTALASVEAPAKGSSPDLRSLA